MKNLNFLLMGIAITTIIAAAQTQVDAAPVIISSTNGNTYINENDEVHGFFSNPFFNIPSYAITPGSLVFNFADDMDPITRTYSGTLPDITQTTTDRTESVRVSVGNQMVDGPTPNSYTVTGPVVIIPGELNMTYIDDISTGLFTLNPILDTTAWNVFKNSGQLEFTLTGIDGDLTFVSAQLSFDAAPIPIPAAFWLFSSGLLGLVCIRKRA